MQYPNNILLCGQKNNEQDKSQITFLESAFCCQVTIFVGRVDKYILLNTDPDPLSAVSKLSMIPAQDQKQQQQQQQQQQKHLTNSLYEKYIFSCPGRRNR